MRFVAAALTTLLLIPIAPVIVRAQAQQPATTISVPRLINVTGIFRPADGNPAVQVEAVTLGIYADELGGAPLWQETQSLEIDPSGRYTLLLGATEASGVPLDVFSSGQARWLGMLWARPGEVEGPRMRLRSVPYALSASNAETLGGKPASAYILSPSASGERKASAGSESTGADAATPSVVNPGTTNYLAKYVNATDIGNSAVYEASGSVGIGTTNPLDSLHVRFTNTNGAFTGYAVQNLGSTASSYSGMLFYDQNGALGQFQGFNNSTHEYRINNIASAGSINFMLGSTSRFFVADSGNIGIGTTAPAALLELARNTETNVFATSYSTFPALGPIFTGRKAGGSAASPTAVQSGETLARFGGHGYGATDFSFFPRGYMEIVAAENWTDAAQGTQMRFSTTTLGTIATPYRMAIDAGGNVGIGTLSPSDKLHVTGEIRVNSCVKDSGGAAIAGTCASDARFKKDVMPFGGVRHALTALQPVHYYWRAAEFPERHFGNSRAYGLIAQDVEEVLPELVVTDEDGYKAVNYSKLPLLTIQAVKELKAENDLLKDRVAELERLIKNLLTPGPSR